MWSCGGLYLGLGSIARGHQRFLGRCHSLREHPPNSSGVAERNLRLDAYARARYAVEMHRVLGISASLLRISARGLLLALSVTTLGPMLHGVHEEDCEPAFVVHDERQHHFQAALPDDRGWPGGDHCVACHFARSSRGPVAWEPSGLSALSHGVLLYHSDGQLLAAPSAAPLPARAPPSLV